MTHDVNLILTLTFAFISAFALGYVAKRLRISPIVGYLAAGILIGEHTPGFIADSSLAGQFAELGVVLLMFGVGLHFHPRELLAVRKVALPGAVVQSLAAAGVSLAVCLGFGWTWQAGLMLGLGVSVASTVVLTRVLEDNKALHTPDGHISVGWLVTEDLLTILVLVLVPAFAGADRADSRLLSWIGLAPAEGTTLAALAPIAITLVKLAALCLLAWFAGRHLVPRLLDHVARKGTKELFILALLSLAIGISVSASFVFGASMALGAFIAGMMVRLSDSSTRASVEILPVRDAFAVLFFISIGMMFDPASILKDWPLMLALLGVVVVAKPLIAMLTVLALRRPLASALRIGIVLGQIGEFSFILASLAIDLKLMPLRSMNVLVAVAMVSIALNPLLYAGVGKLARRLVGRPRLEGQAAEPDLSSQRVVLVGYGPSGRLLHRLMLKNGIEVAVVELNLDTVRQLRQQGIEAVYGDAISDITLKDAGLDRARAILVAAPGVPIEELQRNARLVNPRARIIYRTEFQSGVGKARAAGIEDAFSAEGEVGIAMAQAFLRYLGASEESIAAEMARVRAEQL